MKKLVLSIAMMLLFNIFFAQEKVFLVFEFMKVDNNQEFSYWETESFWEKIHEQQVKNGDIVGWDLWSLKPGGENQGYQYLTVTVYNDIVKMFEGNQNFDETLKAAYPNMTDEEIQNKMTKTNKSRDLGVRMYLEVIKTTKDNFKMKTGMVATLDFMKATRSYEEYENAEINTFLPMHQKAVDKGVKGNWQLIRVISPSGKKVRATHITASMYTGFNQLFGPQDAVWEDYKPSDEDKLSVKNGLKTRDLNWTSIATLIKMVR